MAIMDESGSTALSLAMSVQKRQGDLGHFLGTSGTIMTIPDAQCLVYLPTFGINLW